MQHSTGGYCPEKEKNQGEVLNFALQYHNTYYLEYYKCIHFMPATVFVILFGGKRFTVMETMSSPPVYDHVCCPHHKDLILEGTNQNRLHSQSVNEPTK